MIAVVSRTLYVTAEVSRTLHVTAAVSRSTRGK